MGTDLNFEGDFSAESWEYATAFALSLGTLPTSVTTVVRLLLSDFEKDPLNLSDNGRFFLGRFLKSDSFRASYYFALRCLRPEMIPPQNQALSKERFFEAFSGEEHSLLLTIIFFHRQARRFCDEALFENATSMLQRSLNLGAKIGKTLPSVGMSTGMICSSYQVLAFLPILRHDPEGFLRYSRHLRANNETVDAKFEFDRWQCTSTQIGIMILQRAGFGPERLSKILKATTTRSPILGDNSFERACRAGYIWYQCIATKRPMPAIPLPPQFYIGPQELEGILSSIDTASSDKASSWLSRRKSEVTPETAPQLFMQKQETEIILEDQLVQLQQLPSGVPEALEDPSEDPLLDENLQELLSAEAE